MVDQLQARGVQADVFDIDTVSLPSLAARISGRFPALGAVATTAMMKSGLRRHGSDYDAVNIHFVSPVYRPLAVWLKTLGRRLIASIWGSDFLRASPADLATLHQTLSIADIVTTNNPEVGRKLTAAFPELEPKIRVIPFGMRSLDVIRDLQASETNAETRELLGAPPDKAIVVIGYNASHQQQHGLMVDGLAALHVEEKSRIHVIAPMTYPDDGPYQADIEARLAEAGLSHDVWRGKRDIEDVCRLRIASDYALNMQTTDSLSASIQEHILTGTRMVVGAWLPYGLFEEMGVPILRVQNAADITQAMRDCGLSRKQDECPAYAEGVYQRSSWTTSVGRWMSLFEGQAA